MLYATPDVGQVGERSPSEQIALALELWTMRHQFSPDLLAARRPLAPQHLADLRKSGLSDGSIIRGRFHSIESVTRKGEGTDDAVARRLGWKGGGLTLGPCLVIPFFALDGSPTDFARLKPDRPLMGKKRDGTDRPRKYEQPRGVPVRPYFPRGVAELIADPAEPIVIVEGEKKAAAGVQARLACVGLTGVQCWSVPRGKGEGGPRVLLPELAALPLAGRDAFVAFDSDATRKVEVRQAEAALARALARRGARVWWLRFPAGPGGEKVGLDDFLIASGAAALRGLMDAERRQAPEGRCPRVSEIRACAHARESFSELTQKLSDISPQLGITFAPCPSARLATNKPVLESLADPRDMQARAPACKRLTCAPCFARYLCRRGSHFAGALTCHAGPIHAGEFPAGRWSPVARALCRQKANYVRADPGAGAYSLFATAPFRGSAELAPVEAVARFLDVLRTLRPRAEGRRGKPVFISSRPWKYAVIRDRVHRAVGTTDVRDPEALACFLRDQRVPADSISIREPAGGEWVVDWRLPEGVTHWDRVKLIAYLQDLQATVEAADGPPLAEGDVPW
jgi:hypothetical protein